MPKLLHEAAYSLLSSTMISLTCAGSISFRTSLSVSIDTGLSLTNNNASTILLASSLSIYATSRFYIFHTLYDLYLAEMRMLNYTDLPYLDKLQDSQKGRYYLLLIFGCLKEVREHHFLIVDEHMQHVMYLFRYGELVLYYLMKHLFRDVPQQIGRA